MKNNIKVVAKCVGCGEEKMIKPKEITEDDHPMCPKCFMPMIAKKSINK